MKIANLLQYTEKHRFCVHRDFALGPLQYKMLSAVYQPMIGGLAVALYQTLHSQLPPDRAGYSQIDQQRRLFLSLDLEQGERGRAVLAELSTKLEAIGLLRTQRRYDSEEDDYLYEYVLQPPQLPNDFFRTQHLVWLLHDKIGKHMLTKLRDELLSAQPRKLQGQAAEDVSAVFYDLFRINPFADDEELGSIIEESAETQSAAAIDTHAADTNKFTLEQILQGITHFSENRSAIERLGDKPGPLYDINFIAAKYSLDLADVRWMLDMSGMFDKRGTLLKGRFEEEARLLYLQREKRSDRRTVLTGQREQAAAPAADSGDSGAGMGQSHMAVDPQFYLDVPDMLHNKYTNSESYSRDLRNLGYIQVLELFLPNGVTPQMRETFLTVNTVYGLPDEAMNVLIHFIHVDQRLWERFPIEGLASDMNAKQVRTYEAAVDYIRSRMKRRQLAEAKAREASARGGSRPRAGGAGKAQPQKPRIPIAALQGDGKAKAKPTETEMEEMLRLARKLDQKLK